MTVIDGLYVFVVCSTNRTLVGVFGARGDADVAAKEYLLGDCKMNFKEENYWSWANKNGEVTVEMTKLQ